MQSEFLAKKFPRKFPIRFTLNSRRRVFYLKRRGWWLWTFARKESFVSIKRDNKLVESTVQQLFYLPPVRLKCKMNAILHRLNCNWGCFCKVFVAVLRNYLGILCAFETHFGICIQSFFPLFYNPGAMEKNYKRPLRRVLNATHSILSSSLVFWQKSGNITPCWGFEAKKLNQSELK